MRGKLIKIILLVEDNPGDARLLREMLNDQRSQHTELTHVQYMREAEKHLAERMVDLILLDLGLPDAHGLARRESAFARRAYGREGNRPDLARREMTAGITRSS